MRRRPPLALVLLLLSFPQVVETIYSPALPLITAAYDTTPQEAAQTLSLWFIAFAFGVTVWGRLSDMLGRRPSLIAGLALYAVGTCLASLAADFTQLLAARALAAFGAAVGSIITQTALRDSYHSAELPRTYALLGIALAISPAIGLWLGQTIALHTGLQGVFAALSLLALVLIGLSLAFWPETQAYKSHLPPFWSTFSAMLRDRQIWCNAILIAVFNLAIFGYYQLGPFLFAQLESRWLEFGESGAILALASLAGALCNALLLRKHTSTLRLIRLGIWLLAIGACIVTVWASSPAFMLGMVLVAMAYPIAIPNILAVALRQYSDRLGTSGAIFSMFYNAMLGLGLVASGFGQRLDLLLLSCAILAALTLCTKRH